MIGMNKQEIDCPYCYGDGTWEAECCSGADGCSCGGRAVDMGACRVCGGTGRVIDGEYDIDANRRQIAGLHFVGTGPADKRDIWPNRGGYGQ
jgi:hypothetical protein